MLFDIIVKSINSISNEKMLLYTLYFFFPLFYGLNGFFCPISPDYIISHICLQYPHTYIDPSFSAPSQYIYCERVLDPVGRHVRVEIHAREYRRLHRISPKGVYRIDLRY